jgi:acetyl esterase/lipase
MSFRYFARTAILLALFAVFSSSSRSAATGSATPATSASSASAPAPALQFAPPEHAKLPAPLFQVERHDNLCYLDQPADAKRQSLDLCRPVGVKDAPILLFVHGGGWVIGNREQSVYRRLCDALAARGVVTASVGYRLSPAVKHPAHVEDVAAAIAWVHQHAGEYGGRPDRIFLTGHSAGGHLVALVATDPKFLAAHQLKPADLAGVFPLSGVYSLSAKNEDAPPELKLLRLAFGDDPAVIKDASPIKHVAAGLPPFRLAVGQGEFPLMKAQTRDFCAALAAAGADARWTVVPDRDHVQMVASFGKDDDVVTVMLLDFVRQRTAALDAGKAVPAARSAVGN